GETYVIDMAKEAFTRLSWNFNTNEHAAVVRAMVAVVEEGNVPLVVEAFKKFEQCAGAFGELEAEHHLVVETTNTPTHHMARVELGDFVVGEIGYGEALRDQMLDNLGFFSVATRQFYAQE